MTAVGKYGECQVERMQAMNIRIRESLGFVDLETSYDVLVSSSYFDLQDKSEDAAVDGGRVVTDRPSDRVRRVRQSDR